MLVCQMLAKPAQILSYNSLANLQLYDLYMIWLLMCWADAMLAGFVVVVSFFSQVWLLSCLSSSLCKNSNEFYVGFVYSSLLVFWTPTCRAEHFCNNGFFAINDAAEWERICRGGGRFGQTSFSILFIFYFKVGHFFFSCSVRNTYVLQQEEYFILQQKEKSHQFITTWRERKKGTQVMTGIFSHLLFMSVWSLTIYQVSALSFLNI